MCEHRIVYRDCLKVTKSFLIKNRQSKYSFRTLNNVNSGDSGLIPNVT